MMENTTSVLSGSFCGKGSLDGEGTGGKILTNRVCEMSCENVVTSVSFLWSITVKPRP